MTQIKMIQIAAEMIKQGKTNEEIREALFRIKGARVAQIQKTMKLIA